ncbi:MAG: S8 family serine peptidase, partial [Candidatus Thorarchaeota archaeon]
MSSECPDVKTGTLGPCDYLDPDGSLIVQFSTQLSPQQIDDLELMGIRFLRRGSLPVHLGSVYVVSVSSECALKALGDKDVVRMTRGDKQYFPALMTSVPLIRAPQVWNNLRVDSRSVQGTGTRVAVIDTGIHWLHPSFWRVTTGELQVIQDGSSFYVDLNNNSFVDPGEGPIRVVHVSSPSTIEIANEYMFIDVDNDGAFDYLDGDRWLAGVDTNGDGQVTLPTEGVVLLGEPKVAALYDQVSKAVYVRGVNLTTHGLSVGDLDTGGHGTHVCSIIAGGQVGHTSMLGVAPDADLIVVRSQLTSAQILDGLAFAVAQGADVINLSFSSFMGFLDGTDVEDLAISQIVLQNRTVVVAAAGNLGGQSKHARLSVETGHTGLAGLSVISPPLYSFLNILWQSIDDDEEVILQTPGGSEISLGIFRNIVGSAVEISHDSLKAYVFADRSQRGTNQILVQLGKTGHQWETGTWLVKVSNPQGDGV